MSKDIPPRVIPIGRPKPAQAVPVSHRPRALVLSEQPATKLPAGFTAIVRWCWSDGTGWSRPEYRVGPCTITMPRAASYADVRWGPSRDDGTVTIPTKDKAAARPKTGRRRR